MLTKLLGRESLIRLGHQVRRNLELRFGQSLMITILKQAKRCMTTWKNTF